MTEDACFACNRNRPCVLIHSSSSFNFNQTYVCGWFSICSMGAARTLFFYQSNLLHHFTLLDVFSASILSGWDLYSHCSPLCWVCGCATIRFFFSLILLSTHFALTWMFFSSLARQKCFAHTLKSKNILFLQ